MIFAHCDNRYIFTYNSVSKEFNKIRFEDFPLKDYKGKTIITYNLNLYSGVDFLQKNKDLFVDFLEIMVILFPFIQNLAVFDIAYSYCEKENIVGIKSTSGNQPLHNEISIKLANLYNNLPDYIKNNFETSEQQDLLNIVTYMGDSWWGSRFFSFLKQNQSIKEKDLDITIKNADNKQENNLKFDLFADVNIPNINLSKYNFKENRLGQQEYIKKVNSIFNGSDDNPKISIIEAGTGIGKTLGYLIPAIEFIDKNPNQKILISTYTKTLQKQIIKELKNLKGNTYINKHVAIAKGKNNYICLRNYKYLLNNSFPIKNSKLLVALLFRWVKNTESGDISDISSAVFELIPADSIQYLANNPEECTYTLCPYYKKCFVIKNMLDYKKANIILSNHAFSLRNNMLGVKYVVFDEAHNLFNSVDEVNTNTLSILNLERFITWVLGKKSSSLLHEKFSLKNRIQNIIKEDGNEAEEYKQAYAEIILIVNEIGEIFENLPTYGSIFEVINTTSFISNNYPLDINQYHPLIGFFLHIINHVKSHNISTSFNERYPEECIPNIDKDDKSFISCIDKLINIFQVIEDMFEALKTALDTISVYIETEKLFLVQDFLTVIEEFCINNTFEYKSMLKEVTNFDDNFIYRFLISKNIKGKPIDVGYIKNYVNPNEPFAKKYLSKLRGIVFTSATLGLQDYKINIDKESYINFGLNYLPKVSFEYSYIKSPFDYEKNSHIIVLQDINKDLIEKQNAIQEILTSSKGGGLVIFTSVYSLQQTYKGIKDYLYNQEINIFSQHINDMKMENLISFFQVDKNSCLLGTDLVRDGIDIQGNSLRIVLLEKVPWPRTDILFKARRTFFKHENIQNYIVESKMKQAFGRLIRTKQDKGIFIILEKSVPSVLLSFFKDNNITIQKLTLSEAKQEVQVFLK